jgi:hypothetical protein
VEHPALPLVPRPPAEAVVRHDVTVARHCSLEEIGERSLGWGEKGDGGGECGQTRQFHDK